MKNRILIYLVFLQITLLHADDIAITSSLASTEGLANSLIGGYVCPMTGDFVYSAVDKVIPGPKPLVVQRTYVSGNIGEGHLYKSWQLSEPTKMITNRYIDVKNTQVIVGSSFGANLDFRLRSTKKKDQKYVYTLEPTKGYTNCGTGFLSGQTNLKNHSLVVDTHDKEEKFSGTLRAGDGTERFYGFHHTEGTNRYFHLVSEKKSNRTLKRYTYHKNDLVKEIVFSNAKEDITYGKLYMTGENETPWKKGECVLTANDGDAVSYSYETIKYYDDYKDYDVYEHYLKNVKNHSKPTEIYSYVKACYPYKFQILSKIEWPNKRSLEVEYYTKHTINVGGREVKKGCFNDRVMELKAPVGTDHNPIVIYRIFYHFEPKKDWTEARDALNNRVDYHFSKDHRITDIVYHQNNNVHSFERYVWGPNGSRDEGNLAAKYVQKPNGPILTGKIFYYDDRGNVERLADYGSVTGKLFSEIHLGSDGKPEDNGAEHYDHTFYYDKNNRLISEWENNGKNILYTYLNDTPAITSKILRYNTEVIQREFFDYDDNLFLIRKIVDDGHSLNRNDEDRVSFMKITYHIPRDTFPFGFSKEIKETYHNCVTGEEYQLKRIVNEYSIKGKLTRQDYYDADNKFQYALSWEHDNHGNLIKETNAVGNVIIRRYDENDNIIYQQGPVPNVETEYFYDYSNRLIKSIEKHCDAHLVTQHRYDLCGNKISTIDNHGNETRFEYDELNRLKKIIYPLIEEHPGLFSQPIEEFTYDLLGHYESKTDKTGKRTYYLHNCQGKPLYINHPDGSVESFEYWQEGTLAKSVSKNGSSTHFDLDCLGRIRTETVRSPTGDVLSVKKKIWGAAGLLSEIDPEGIITDYTYDAAARLVSKQIGKSKTDYLYDSLGRVSKEIEWISATHAQITIYEYDLLNRVIEERNEDLSGKVFSCIKTCYDINGNKILINDNGSITKKVFNSHNEPIQITDAEGNITYVQYDHQFRNDYKQLVDKITTTDPLGNQTIIIKDVSGNTVRVAKRDAYGKLLARQYNYYNANGLLVQTRQECILDNLLLKIIDTEWTYTADNQVKSLKEAVGTSDERIRTYEYNSMGQKTSLIKPDNTVIYYAYDSKGRLSNLKSSDATIFYRYYYNRNDEVVEVHDLINETTIIRSYDSEGRLSSETQAHGRTIKYAYDKLGRKIQLSLPDKSTIDYVYDAYNLSEVKRYGYSHNYQEYNTNSKPTKIKHFSHAGISNFTYDMLQRPISIIHPKRSQENTFDAVGNLLEYNDSTKHTFTYDDLYQLTSEEGLENHSYKFDSVNNRVKKDTTSCPYNNLNQLLSQEGVNFSYDKNGNLIKKTVNNVTTNYTYDALSRLITLSTPSSTTHYIYDPFDRRISKCGKTNEEYLYDGQNEIGIYSSDLTVIRILGSSLAAEIGGTIAIETDQIIIPLHDHNGNVVSLVSEKGELLKKYDYTAFGQEINSDPNDLNPYRFASKHFDDESGLIYFGRRYYDPSIARWISPDPSDYDDGPNLYAYLHNNPLTHYDAYGLMSEENSSNQGIGSYLWSYLTSPYLHGTLQMVGGASEISAGAAMTFYSGGAAGVAGWPIMAHGGDHFLTGLQTLYTGKYKQTASAEILQKTGLSPNCSSNIDVGLSVTGTLWGIKCGARTLERMWQPRLPSIKPPTMDPGEIRFTQDSIKSSFKDGRTIESLIEGLRSGTTAVDSVKPIRVFMRDGRWYSLDNRRLYAFKEANKPIPYEIVEESLINPKRFTTENDGISIIIRGQQPQ